MIPIIIILATAVIFALIRAKHDSFIAGGRWKVWAFVEGCFFAVATVALTLLAFGLPWWLGFVLGPVFAFSFWLVFDCVVGWLLSGSILYIGNQGFDLQMRKMFLYNKPIFGWEEPGAIRQIFFKAFWIFLLLGAYFSF